MTVMSYYTRSQAQAKQQTEFQAQAKQQQQAEQTEQTEQTEQEQPLPSTWYTVNIPTCYTYRYREEDVVRAMKDVKRILSEIEASESMERVIDLFEYLMQFPFILIVRPSIPIQQKIKDFKPIIAEQERRLAAFHTAHETMVKSLASLNSQVQKAGMHLLREYVVFQKEMARWMHLKDIMGKVENIIKN